MLQKTLLQLSIGAMLVGCSASIPVSKIDSGQRPSAEGTFLILPRTALSVKYNRVNQSFNAGIWTDEVERCDDVTLANEDDASPERRRNALAASADSCRGLAELGISSRRLSRQPGAFACKDTDSVSSESRSRIDATSIVVTPVSQPDPDQVYWVTTPSRWFGDADVTVKYAANGSVDGAKAVVTNAWADFATSVVGAALRTALTGTGAAPKKAALLRRCEILDPDMCDSFVKDLDKLKNMVSAKLQAAQVSSGPTFEQQMAVYDAPIAAQRALFEGSVSTKTNATVDVWVPDSKTQTWASAYVSTCPAPKGSDVAPRFPAFRLSMSAHTSAEGEVLHKALANALETSRNGFGVSSSERGFPYRTPVEADVKADLLACKAAETCAPKGSMMPAKFPIAQFGDVGRLTARAGGRKGTIDVDYYADTGALTSVQVAGEGSSNKPITDVLADKLPKAPQSEIDKLKTNQTQAESMAAICTAYQKLTTPPPSYCANPRE